jgi:hypothetical protein
VPDAPLTWPLLLGLLLLGGLIGSAAAAAFLLRGLDRRERRLEHRLVELRRRIAQLECRLEPSGTTKIPEPAHAAPTGPRAAARDAAQEAREWPARATLIAVPDLAREAAPGDPQAGEELGQKHREIWALAEAGTPIEEIARQTGQPIGEVELIVGLRRRLHPPRGATEHVRSE